MKPVSQKMHWSNPIHAWVWAALSGFFAAWAFCSSNQWLGLVALVPLFVVVQSAAKLTTLGMVFGIAFFGWLYAWIVSSWHLFTGLHSLTGLLPFLLTVSMMTAPVAGLFFAFGKMRQATDHEYAAWQNPLLWASLWTLMESGRMYLFASFPFFACPNLGFPLTADIYALQPVSVFGLSILTFVVVFFSASLAQAVATRQVRQLALPFVFLLAYWGLGFGLCRSFEKPQTAPPDLEVTLLCLNLDAEFKWNEANGNTLVRTILGQYETALKTNPDLVVWPESAVPWTYAPDDPFLLELSRLTAGKPTRNIMGMLTDAEDTSQLYNSAYLLEPNGTVAARYDKRIPLALFEAPFLGYQMPFRTLDNMTGKAGNGSQTLPTPNGKAGVMICNESVIPASAALMANARADFLVNISNDAWFSSTYLPLQHFYNARARAVETRRDVFVNSNQGYSGHIAASGEITRMEQDHRPKLISVSGFLNTQQTIATQYPYWFLVLLLIFLFLYLKSKPHHS